jgi:BNR/Asp-box repeat
VGLDANGDGTLQASEANATQTQYVCNGSSGGVSSWVSVAAGTQAMARNTGYVAEDGAAAVAFTLPPTASLRVGDVLRVAGSAAGGWTIAQAADQRIDYGRVLPTAGRWVPREAARDWRSVAMSSDGRYAVAAAQSGQLYTSTDHGATWTPRETARAWTDVTSSADGRNLAASVFGGAIYTSPDFGVTWTARGPNRNHTSISSSASGTRLIATTDDDQVHQSADFGATWTTSTLPGGFFTRINSVAMSADGSRLFAGNTFGSANFNFLSTDFGTTWRSPAAIQQPWAHVASSADGCRIVGASFSTGLLQVSNDCGATFSSASAGVHDWASVAMSAEGQHLLASTLTGRLHLSADFGVTWTEHESARTWAGVAVSGDGTRMMAVHQGGQIYTRVRQLRESEPGPTGGLEGAQGSLVELLYVGGGRFMLAAANGSVLGR